MSEEIFQVGGVPARPAYEILQAEPGSVLIDVRTAEEWTYVGIPDLSALRKQAIFLTWQSYPAMQQDPNFAERLKTILDERAVLSDAALLFICRSGARSLAAGQAMTRVGFRRCLNVRGGFEGPLDANLRRGSLDGWKAAGLPWSQA